MKHGILPRRTPFLIVGQLFSSPSIILILVWDAKKCPCGKPIDLKPHPLLHSWLQDHDEEEDDTWIDDTTAPSRMFYRPYHRPASAAEHRPYMNEEHQNKHGLKTTAYYEMKLAEYRQLPSNVIFLVLFCTYLYYSAEPDFGSFWGDRISLQHTWRERRGTSSGLNTRRNDCGYEFYGQEFTTNTKYPQWLPRRTSVPRPRISIQWDTIPKHKGILQMHSNALQKRLPINPGSPLYLRGGCKNSYGWKEIKEIISSGNTSGPSEKKLSGKDGYRSAINIENSHEEILNEFSQILC